MHKIENIVMLITFIIIIGLISSTIIVGIICNNDNEKTALKNYSEQGIYSYHTEDSKPKINDTVQIASKDVGTIISIIPIKYGISLVIKLTNGNFITVNMIDVRHIPQPEAKILP